MEAASSRSIPESEILYVRLSALCVVPRRVVKLRCSMTSRTQPF